MNGVRWNKQYKAALVLAGLVILSLLVLRPAAATPPRGITPQVKASGALPEAVRVKLTVGESGFAPPTLVKKIMVVEYTLAPGGSFGWHQHAGPVWAVVTSGTLSIYDGDDPTCTPTLYPAESVLLDPGSDTHLGINETDAPVVIYATFMLPEDGAPRIDAANPGLCPNLE